MWKTSNTVNIALFSFIALLATIFLTYNLVQNPPGFFIDESINGYEAYHLLHNGGHSSNGDFLPRYFQNPNDSNRSHTSFIYLISLSVAFLGLNELSVRIVSVVISLYLLAVLFLHTQQRYKKSSVYLGLVLFPVTGWVFLLARNGIELMYYAFLYFLCFALLIRLYEHGLKEIIRLFDVNMLGAASLLLFYAHSSGKLLSPVIFVFSLFALIILLIKKRKSAGKGILVLLFWLILTVLLTVPYLLDGTFFYRATELKDQCPQHMIECFGKNILSNFDPVSYFKPGYVPTDFPVYRHSVTTTTLIPQLLGVFLVSGIIFSFLYLLKKRSFYYFTLLFFILLAAVPSSLTIRGFDSWRSAGFIGFIFLFAIIGFHGIFTIFEIIMQRIRVKDKLKKGLFAGLLIVLVFMMVIAGINEVKKINDYEYSLAAAGYGGWQYGYREIFSFIKTYGHDYDRIVVSDKIAYVADLYIRFYDPEGEFSNIEIGDLNTETDCEDTSALFVVTADAQVCENFKELHTVYYPNGVDVAFRIGAVVK